MTEFTHVRLKDYPFATVRFACIRCDRQGMHQRSELIARHGPEIPMLELRELITGCKPRRGKPCGAYYPDFVAG
jgi:hypothetical protein